MHDFSIILLQYIAAHKKFKIFMVNLSQLESTMVSVCFPMKQHFASPGGRRNHGNSATGQPPAPVTLIGSVHGIDYTYQILSVRRFSRGVGGWDNRLSNCARDSAQ